MEEVLNERYILFTSIINIYPYTGYKYSRWWEGLCHELYIRAN